MWTVLFDIDGTLLRARGAGRLAMQRAWKSLYGEDELPQLTVHGRTDRAIIEDLFAHFAMDPDRECEEFYRRYWENLPAALAEVNGELLPGVSELVGMLHRRPDVSIGLLTGNARVPAYHKLAHFGLESFFPFGGFGDHDTCRNRVAARARDDAARQLGAQFRPDRVWVVGDTIHDISCARSIDSRVLAVWTGGEKRESLEQAGPDLLVADLSDPEAILEQVLGP